MKTKSIVAYFYHLLQRAKNYNFLHISSVDVGYFEMAIKNSQTIYFQETLQTKVGVC